MDDETGRKKYGWLWDSSTFRAVFEEGFQEGLEQVRIERRVVQRLRALLDLGTEKFGVPSASVVDRLDRSDDLDTLDHLLTGILTASSWQELVATVPEH